MLPWCFILLQLPDCVAQIPGAMATVTSVINLLVLFAHSLNRIPPPCIIIYVRLACGSVLENSGDSFFWASFSFFLSINTYVDKCIFFFSIMRIDCKVGEGESSVYKLVMRSLALLQRSDGSIEGSGEEEEEEEEDGEKEEGASSCLTDLHPLRVLDVLPGAAVSRVG